MTENNIRGICPIVGLYMATVEKHQSINRFWKVNGIPFGGGIPGGYGMGCM